MPDMDYETLLVDEQDGITTITVDRPDALNALNATVLAELDAVTTTIASARGATRGVILTGSGEKAFIAGADIKAMSQMSPDEAEAFSRLGQRVTTQLESLPVTVIACVNGFALGGGCEMAMACDFIYATGNARFGQPEVSLGLIPGFGGCVRLIRYVGPGHAKELIYSGRHVKADEAARLGLVNIGVRDEGRDAGRRGDDAGRDRQQIPCRRRRRQVGDQRDTRSRHRGRPRRRSGGFPRHVRDERHARRHHRVPREAPALFHRRLSDTLDLSACWSRLTLAARVAGRIAACASASTHRASSPRALP